MRSYSRKTSKALDLLVDCLPDGFRHSTYQTTINGEDAILAGTTEIDGEKVDPEKEYVLDNNLMREVNHKRRLKKAFKKNGKEGVVNYCRQFLKEGKGDDLLKSIDLLFS